MNRDYAASTLRRGSDLSSPRARPPTSSKSSISKLHVHSRIPNSSPKCRKSGSTRSAARRRNSRPFWARRFPVGSRSFRTPEPSWNERGCGPMMTLVTSMTLGDLTVRNLELRPAAPAVIFEGRTITHAEFAGRAFRLANALLGLGIQRGDRVAILAQNCPEYMETYAAGELGGWTTVTINFRLTAAEIAYILSDSRPKCIIVDAQFVDRLPNAVAAGVQHVLTFGGPGLDLAYEDALAQAEASRPQALVQPEDIAHLVYTSGTTGKPKGVMLSHRAQVQSALISALEAQVRPTDRLALAMPLYHVGAKNQWLSHSVYGCPIILHRAFRPSP